MKQSDPWVNLIAEREALWQCVEDTPLVDGNVPDDVAKPCFCRMEEIDALIGGSQPLTDGGLRDAFAEYLRRAEQGDMPSEEVVLSLLRAAMWKFNKPTVERPKAQGAILIRRKTSEERK